MSSTLQPIKIYGKTGPNPPKVAMLAKELNIPHEIIPLEFSELKKPPFLAINPNGRMPAIYDPNTDLTLWESGAILEYLIEKYDTEYKVSFKPGTNEHYLAKQWLFFQVSGQGPYYGQSMWFKKIHHEKLPSAVERYDKEVIRVSSLLDEHLGKQKSVDGDGPWLVGGKFSYADFAFLPWQVAAIGLAELEGAESTWQPAQFPHVQKWIANMKARPALNQVLEDAKH